MQKDNIVYTHATRIHLYVGHGSPTKKDKTVNIHATRLISMWDKIVNIQATRLKIIVGHDSLINKDNAADNTFVCIYVEHPHSNEGVCIY